MNTPKDYTMFQGISLFSYIKVVQCAFSITPYTFNLGFLKLQKKLKMKEYYVINFI
jgi:hypothetical protein